MKPALVVLAAGFGRRYGGAKQIEPVGGGGEALVDYSIHDALRAGFGRLVFVVREAIESELRRTVGRRWSAHAEICLARQDAAAAAAGTPRRRRTPWGTGHAVLAAQRWVEGPFAVVNADDFYGADAFRSMHRFLSAAGQSWALAGYRLRDTLPPNGAVSRALCEHDDTGRLRRIRERPGIVRASGGAAAWKDDSGELHRLSGDETVSMNLWGFTPAVFAALEGRFEAFMGHRGRQGGGEFGLPGAIGELLASGQAEVTVLPARGPWLGLTHGRDHTWVAKRLAEAVRDGAYPASLPG